MRKFNYKAPFLEDGGVPSYPLAWRIINGEHKQPTIDWREVEPFWATLRFIGMDKGSHGSTRYVLENVNTKAKYSMFTVEALDILMNEFPRGGFLEGYWRVQKRGTNYGIKYLGETSGD
jgi:hypothetical protein